MYALDQMVSAPTENEMTVAGMAEYIEREEAIRMLRGSAIEKYPLSFSSGILASAYVLENLPAADVAPVRHGQWERDEWGSYLRICSVCKKLPVYQDERGNSVAVYAGVCINCGAKMDGDASQKMKR